MLDDSIDKIQDYSNTLDEAIELQDKNNTFPKKVERSGPRNAGVSHTIMRISERKITGGFNARSNSTDISANHRYKTSSKGGDNTSPLKMDSVGFISHDGYSRSSERKRTFDGTSERAIVKAMSTYMNRAGVGDYTLP